MWTPTERSTGVAPNSEGLNELAHLLDADLGGEVILDGGVNVQRTIETKISKQKINAIAQATDLARLAIGGDGGDGGREGALRSEGVGHIVHPQRLVAGRSESRKLNNNNNRS